MTNRVQLILNNYNKAAFLFVFIILHIPVDVDAQQNNFEVGSFTQRNVQGAYYDFGEQNKLNIRVSIWGYVRFPGRYAIPSGSTISDLISYAGGPTPEAYTDEIRHFRMEQDSSYVKTVLDYEDILYDFGNALKREKSIQLNPGDIVSLPGTQRMYFKDWIGTTLSLISVVISISILIFK